MYGARNCGTWRMNECCKPVCNWKNKVGNVQKVKEMKEMSNDDNKTRIE